MNHQLDKLSGMDDDEFKHVAGTVWTDQEVAQRVVAELDPDRGVLVGMLDVFVGDPVTTGRAMDLHTQ